MKIGLNLFLLIFLVSCTQSGDSGPNGPSTPSDPKILFMNGGLIVKPASLSGFEINSQPIYNELDMLVADGTTFTVTGEDGVQVSTDNITFASTANLTSLLGKVKFFVKAPTTLGTYRAVVKPNNSTALGRFYISVEPGEPELLGTIQGTRYEDTFPYNNIKDDFENWTLLGDGQATTYISVGPILDVFGNPVTEAKIFIEIDKGSIISENPVTVSDGIGFFRIESIAETGLISIHAQGLNSQDETIADVFGVLELVRPNLVIEEDGNFGNVFVNQEGIKNFILKNEGTTSVTNLFYNAGNPFSIDPTSTCLTKSRLRPQEQCQLIVKFVSGIRQTFTANLSISGTPTTVSTASLVKELTASGVAPAEIRISESTYDFGTQVCGVPIDHEVVITNIGDLPGNNFRVSQPPPHSGQSTAFIELILPPQDPSFPSDMDSVVNCGTTVPAGRKCRVILRFSPESLVTSQPLSAEIAIDGQNPIGLTLRGASQPGPPNGVIPVALQFPTMPLISTTTNNVTVGPIKDGCGIVVADGYTVNATVTGGGLILPSAVVNGGMATFGWTGSANPADIGTQTISVTSELASGSRNATFQGIKLNIAEITGAIGQVVTSKPKTFFYSLENQGNVSALNLNITLDDNPAWGVIDQNYVGGCQDGILLAGEICTIKVTIDTLSTGAATLESNLRVTASGNGLNEVALPLAGFSVLPPVIVFDSATPGTNPIVSLGNFIAGNTPTYTLTLRNLSAGTVNDLVLTVNSPFEQTSTTCGTTLPGGQTCTISVRLLVNTASPSYTTEIQARGEASTGANGDQATAKTRLSAGIVAGPASGVIPMSFNVSSVPANTVAEITATIGPVKDAYDNIVIQNTPVEISSANGKIDIDTDSDGVAIVGTNAAGQVVVKIKSRTTSEITSFTMNSKVYDGATVIASGSRTGAFTGSILEFTADSIDFGGVPVGTLDFRSITLRNNGNETATGISFVSSSNDFVLLSGTGSCTSLAPNTSCNITVGYFPAQAGPVAGTININASGNGVLQDSITITAIAIVAAKIEITSINEDTCSNPSYTTKTTCQANGEIWTENNFINSLSSPFTPGGNASGSFKIKNIGGENLISTVVSINTRVSEFSFTVPSSCQTLASNQSCTVTFNFLPTGTVPSTLNTLITVTSDSDSRTTIDTLSLNIVSPQIALTQKQFSQNLNACGSYQLQLQDTNENPVVATTNLTTTLSTNGTGGFFSNSGCTTSITQTTISNGQSSSPVFYYKGTGTGNHLLTMNLSVLQITHQVVIFTPPVISPATVTLAPNGSQNFTTSGGSNPLVYTVVTPGGGSINDSSGNYTAPALPGTYTVRVTDNLGNASNATVTVEAYKISSGLGFTCYTSLTSPTCFGQNGYGQYGTAKVGNRQDPVPVLRTTSANFGVTTADVITGLDHACVIRQSDNRLFCQGLNNMGQLGNGNTTDSSSGVAVTGSFTVLTSGVAKRKVSLGWGFHTCAVNSSNQIYCWGRNDQGQVGINNTTYKTSTPTRVTVAGTEDFIQVSAGEYFSCGLHNGGTINCWGYNSNGQLGNNTTTNAINSSVVVVGTSGSGTLTSIKEISAGRRHTCALDTSNNLYCWGDNSSGQLGIGNTTQQNKPTLVTSNVRNVYAGGTHTCLVKTSGELQCFGQNAKGQIGNNSTTNVTSPTQVSGITTQVGDVAPGFEHTCVVHNGSEIKCWGGNGYGTILQGDTNNYLTPQIINNSAATSCPSGMSYNGGTSTCQCSNSTHTYNYSTTSCEVAGLTISNASYQYITPGTSVELQGRAINTNSFMNIPVVYNLLSGNGTLQVNKVISSDAGYAYNYYTKGSQNEESWNAQFPSASVSSSYFLRNVKLTCNEYAQTYGLNSTAYNGAYRLAGAYCFFNEGACTSVDYTGYCRFGQVYTSDSHIWNLGGFTYSNVTDYTNGGLFKTFNEPFSGLSVNDCPTGTRPVVYFLTLSQSCNAYVYTNSDLQCLYDNTWTNAPVQYTSTNGYNYGMLPNGPYYHTGDGFGCSSVGDRCAGVQQSLLQYRCK